MIDVPALVGLVLAVVSPICSAAYVVGKLGAELRAVRRDVDRHESEIRELRRVGAM